MKKLSLFLMISTFVVFSGCKKDDASTYAVGGYYDKNGITGIICRVSSDGNHGTVVSLDEAKLPWSLEYVTTGASDYMNGPFNTNTIISNFDLEKYPAFKWCNDKNTNGVTGWFIPSFIDFFDMFGDIDDVNKALSTYGGILISKEDDYWSSEEISTSTALIENAHTYYDYITYTDGKSDSLNVRALYKF